MEQLKLKRINLLTTAMGTKIVYDYDAPEKFCKYVKGEQLFVEFPGDIRDVPESILAVPFAGIMLTVGMLLDVDIVVPSLDETFYGSVNRLEAVYRKMYPRAGIRCNICADMLNDNKLSTGGGRLKILCSSPEELMPPVPLRNWPKRNLC